MLLPKSKSWAKARYVVRTEGSKELILCRFNHKEKSFMRYTQVGDMYSSWGDWVTVGRVTSWVRVDEIV